MAYIQSWGSKRMKHILLCALLALLSLPAYAQCPALQDQALSSVASACAEQAVEAICFGSPTVSLAGLPEDTATGFAQPGDEIAAHGIQWFSVSSEDKTWGVARLLFEAYAPASLDSQIAALLAFGDVAIFPSASAAPATLLDITVAAAQGANLRAEANMDAPVIKTIADRKPLKAVGLSDDGGWVLAFADPETSGWISRDLVQGDLSSLGIVPAEGADDALWSLWSPWQSLDFRSGIDDAPCPGAPASGMLLQTNQFQPPRQFWLNDLPVLLNGVVFLQAQVDAGMSIYVLDGEATITAPDARMVVKSGFSIHVPLGGGADSALAPAAPRAYNYQDMLRLPIDALYYDARVGFDPYTIIKARPLGEQSPLEGISADAPCKITAGAFGANIRSNSDPEAPVIGVMGHRESANPVARAIGSDELLWWKLADHVWVRIDATITGGKCSAVPLIASDS